MSCVRSNGEVRLDDGKFGASLTTDGVPTRSDVANRPPQRLRLVETVGTGRVSVRQAPIGRMLAKTTHSKKQADANMRVLVNGRWTGGFLDYHRRPDEYLVEPIVWKNLERIHGMYYQPRKSPRTIWNYFWEIGLRQTIRKVFSRAQERLRNEKYTACGIGYVRETPAGGALSAGQTAVFLAPCHPRLVERICLRETLLKPVESRSLAFLPSRDILCYSEPNGCPEADKWWASVRAWSQYSGIGLSSTKCDALLNRALDSLKSTNWDRAVRVRSNPHPSIVQSRVTTARPRDGKRKSAVLFGYGNYAKNITIPNMKPHFDIRCVHEVDPLQTPQGRLARYGWDTSPSIRDDENYDVYLIAGFHHTHAPLAIDALKKGGNVLLEKPIAVDKEQLADLIEAMNRTTGKVFSCFHKRYSPFNVMARKDLCLQQGEPVCYHCIVFEAPLPPDHWYRWPNSKSRFITNGCHWIDHFLFLNDYSEATACDLTVASDRNSVNCAISLANGAFFTMVMTYYGSERIGTQDYVELRARDSAVRIVNEGAYLAEANHRILRRRRLNKIYAYNRMYQDISRRINLGEGGDSIASVKGAAELGFRLDDLLQRRSGR